MPVSQGGTTMNHVSRFHMSFKHTPLLLFFIIMTAPVFAVSGVISYQGILKNNSGQPITTPVEVTFTFWDAETGGAKIGTFSDTDATSPSKDGLFTTTIGDDPGNPIPESTFASDSVWLNISVDGTNLAPRTRMTSVGYAINTGNADTLDGQHAANFSPSDHSHNLSNLAGILKDGQIPAAITRDPELALGLASKADTRHAHGKSDLATSGVLAFVWKDSEVADNLTIFSGTINNASIGEILPTTGYFTHIAANSNVVLGDQPTDIVTINGALKISSGLPGENKVLTSDAAGNALWEPNDADTLDGFHAAAFRQRCPNIRVVAKSGGDYSTIGEALDSITDASNTKRYLVYVAPGIYNEQVSMKPHVDIEGAGELLTKITYTGSSMPSNGTVSGSDFCELRFLTVENTGGNDYAVAISNSSSSLRITHVTAIASGAANTAYGISNVSATPVIKHVIVSVTGTYSCTGIYNSTSDPFEIVDATVNVSGENVVNGIYSRSSSVGTIRDTTVNVSGGVANYAINNQSALTLVNVIAGARGIPGNSTTGIYNSDLITMTDVIVEVSGGEDGKGISNTGPSMTMTNVTAGVINATDTNYGVYTSGAAIVTMNGVTISASGGTGSCAVYNSSSTSLTMNHVTAKASGGSSSNEGLYNKNAPANAENCIISARGPATNFGIYNTATSDSYSVIINNCQITGSTNTIISDAEYTVKVGGSLLSGGPVSNGGGTCICAGVWDENYTFYASTCP